MSIANDYLVEYDTQIIELSIRPTSMHHWQFPSLKLTVHNSEISIKDLALTLDTDLSLLSLYSQQLSSKQVMSLIKQISVAEIHAELNPGVLTDEGKNVDDQGPTLLLDLNALPQINIGTTSLSLAGISASALSLTVEHLTLDEDGKLSTAISRNDKAIFQLDAHLTKKQWRVSSLLVFDELYAFLTELAAQTLDTSALAPLLALKQESERVGLILSGTLESNATLDLKSAQLASSHILKHSSLTLMQFDELTLAPHSLSAWAEEPLAQDRVEFDIAGHLVDLTLTLAPFTLEVSPSHHQVHSLLSFIQAKRSIPLVATILEHSTGTPSGGDKPQARIDEKPKIKLSFTLSQPLEYSFDSNTIHLRHAQLMIRDARVDASLSATDLSLQLPTQTQAFELESAWQFAASRESALSLSSLLPNGPSSFADRVVSNKTIADIRLGASSLSLAGKINIETPTASESPQFRLSINPHLQAQIGSVALIPHSVKQDSARKPKDNPKFQFELKHLKLVSHDELVMTSSEARPMNLDIPRLTFSIDSTRYRHGIQTDLPSVTKELSFDASSLKFSTLAMSHLLIINSLVNESLASNHQASNSTSKLALSAFTLESEDVQFTQSTSSGDSLRVSTGVTRLTSLDPLVIQRTTDSANEEQQPIQIRVPPLKFEQLDNELALKPVPSAEQHEYLAKLSGLYLSLEKTSSLVIPAFTSEAMSRVLTENLWRNYAHYELNGAELTHHHIKNNRKRTEKLLDLYTANLAQTLDWNGVKLDTHEDWEFDGLEFVSEHSLRPQISTQADSSRLQLTGKVNLDSDVGTILALVSNNYSLPKSLFITGDARLQAEYELNKNDKTTQVSINFTPELTSLSGSVNELPFEQADIQASCHYQMEQLNQSSSLEPTGTTISTLSCPDIQFSAAAFNPGILLTDIKAQVDFSVSLDDKIAAEKVTEPAEEERKSQGPDVGKRPKSAFLESLSAANIQMNASGELLGGRLLLPEFNLKLHGKSHGYLILQGLELEQLLAIQPQVGLYADGIFDGVLPVDLVQGKISISGGKLAARAPGGLISVSGNPAVDQMRLSQPYLDFAFSTMEHLQYSELASTFDMAPNGDALLKVNVKGKAKGIERPIQLNYSQEENMLQLLKSLQIGDKLQTQIEQSMK
ncbi:YdbH domain-containing protein [Shewanella sp.]|uniref:intermembrane phospholipid transport protein YdbH family protein n=1 Tax=Shewanella sp. TaxID=50422 RepID=UPI0025FCCADD|nr:YdbH domain-containing protein [Shewanella sp.]